MVYTRRSKASRLTYADRVLGALSHIQTEHRKHAVHMATIRAQIKKDAQARKDQLGPRWSNHVTKAIHKLENEGILAPESSGNVTMTPAGKKVLSAARRRIPESSEASTLAIEDQVLRQISRSVSAPRTPRGIKRARGVSGEHHGRESLGTDASVSTGRPQRSPTKRARMSTGSTPVVRGPFDRMTKAQLKAEIFALQRRHAEAERLWRETSPLTDLEDDEEIERLREELKEREADLEAARNQLETLKEHANDGDAGGITPLSYIPDDTSEGPPSSPTRPLMPNIFLNRKKPSFDGITRTQSGSIIPNLSKQPTPAPSTPGDERFDERDDDDFFGPNSGGTALTHPLMTPVTTPVKLAPTRSKHAVHDDDDDDSYATDAMTLVALKKASTEVTTLKNTLDSRNVELQALENRISHISATNAQLENRLTECDGRIVALEEQVAAEASAVTSKDDELEVLKKSKAEAEGLYEKRIEDLHESIRTSEESLSHMQATNTEYINQLSVVNAEITELASRIQSIQTELEEQQSKSESLAEERKKLGEEFDEQREIIEASKRQEQETSNKLTHLIAEMETLRGEHEATLRTLKAANANNEVLSIKLRDTQCKNEELVKRVDALKQEKDAAQKALGEREASHDKEKKTLHEDIAAQQSALDQLQKETSSLKLRIDELEQTLSATVVELGEANAQVQTINFSLVAAKDELVQQTAANSTLAEQLEAAKTNITLHQEQLRASQNRCTQLSDHSERQEQELHSVRKALSTTESMAGAFHRDLDDARENNTSLQLQLGEAQERIKSGEVRIAEEMAEKARIEEALRDARTAMSALEIEVTKVNSEMEKLRIECQGLEGSYNTAQEELQKSGAALEEETARGKKLEAELASTFTKLQALEEEIVELGRAKEADEKTIGNLKHMFSVFRDNQERSLTEMGEKFLSMAASPRPSPRIREAPGLSDPLRG